MFEFVAESLNGYALMCRSTVHGPNVIDELFMDPRDIVFLDIQGKCMYLPGFSDLLPFSPSLVLRRFVIPGRHATGLFSA